MLSGNGRHRRPRQAPALVVAAGVAGSAIALPLLGATGANAADTATWDLLAHCESGGAWSADPGNGYYGGLQLSPELWHAYGGLDYAPSADKASRSQQIAVAEKVLAALGPQAWPGCGAKVGLEKGGAAAEVNPGLPGSGAADESTGSGRTATSPVDGTDDSLAAPGGKHDAGKAERPSGTPSHTPGSSASPGPSDPASSSPTGSASAPGTGTPSNSSAPSASDTPSASDSPSASDTPSASDSPSGGPSGSPSGDDSATPGGTGATVPGGTGTPDNPTADGGTSTGSGKHRGASADESAAASRADDGSGRHASRAAAERAAGDARYTVRPGDSLSLIADSHDVRGGWNELYAGNARTVGSDPNLILPGQTLDLSGEKGETGQ